MLQMLQMIGSGSTPKLYADDVFSTYLYTGNGSTQTINNGIDLAGKGGLVWTKARSGASIHNLTDTVRGARISLSTDNANAQYTSGTGQDVTGFLQTGYTLGTDNAATNASGTTHVSWTFRRTPKFFDVVTYTGNGTSNRQIAHSLGAQAGFVTVKATSTTGDWSSYHRSATGDLKLNLTDAQTASRAIITAADASTFTVSGVANTNGVSYVAYLWAHDPSAEGIIQCGSYVGNGSSAGPTVTLGWETQCVIVKAAGIAQDWLVFDTMRGMSSSGGSGAWLIPNTSAAEATTASGVQVSPTATGFQINSAGSSFNSSGVSYIYLAIRRPNKPPTTGTEVFNTKLQYIGDVVPQSNRITNVGFVVDAYISNSRNSDGVNPSFMASRIQGPAFLSTHSTAAEAGTVGRFDEQFGVRYTYGQNNTDHAINLFRRAPGFFDVVCYTGTGVARTVPHGLGVAPELMIFKGRSSVTNWSVYHKDLGDNSGYPNFTEMNGTFGKFLGGATFFGIPTSTTIALGSSAQINDSSATFVAYLFATLPGISKVGSYTGNGSSQTIDCGFGTGSRLVLIKRTDSAGNWIVADSVRGIVAAGDPALYLNSVSAEVTGVDWCDPTPSGFVVIQEPTMNVNVNGAQYAFLAIS